MTLAEAIESGRPFKRPTWVSWIQPIVTWQSISLGDIGSDDWMIKRDPIIFEIHAGDDVMKVLAGSIHGAGNSLKGERVRVTIEVIE